MLEPVQWGRPRHASVPIKVRPLGILWRVNPSQVPSCHAEVPRSLELHQSWIARAQRFISLGRHAVVCWRRRCSYFFAFTKLGCRRASSAKVGHERVRRRFSGTVTPMSFRIMSVFITMSTNIICTQQSDYRLAFCRKTMATTT